MTTEMSPTAELLQKARGRKVPTIALIALALAGVLLVGGGGFALGRVTAPSRAFAGFRGGTGGNGFPGFGGGVGGAGGGGFGGRGGLQGTVESISGDTMTLKTANGSIVTVTVSSSTTYVKQVAAQASDITQGATVRIGVSFTAGAPVGGSIPATSVTLITP
jgi:hypothetical protein